MTPPFGGVFVSTNQVMDRSQLDRAIRRMAHEIIDRNGGTESLIVIGLQTGGVPLAGAIASALETLEKTKVPLGSLDVALHRDDIGLRPVMPEAVTTIPVDLDNTAVVLVDDVLFTGRTIRAALDALTGFGRPKVVQLAVMIDRGHRELPIRPDFVGKNLPTRRNEVVDVDANGVDIGFIEKYS